jgi:3-oxoacyl-(acyl-carrier-protein) synthase
MADVVITGFGVVSPLGHSAAELARRVAAGERAADDANGVRIGEDPARRGAGGGAHAIGRLDRLCRLALSASFLAVDDAGLALPLVRPERVGLRSEPASGVC